MGGPSKVLRSLGAACQSIVDASKAPVEGQRSWNTPAALSIVARAPSLRAYGYWPVALSIVEAGNCTWYSKEGLSL